MSDPPYQDLLDHLRAEAALLQSAIDEALKESDFATAKRLAKGYRIINRQLRALEAIGDPHFEERERQLRRLKGLETMVEKEDNEKLRALLMEEIGGVREALNKLSEPVPDAVDTQYIDDALFQLVEGKIGRFRLYLNREDELVFDFTCTDRTLRIGFGYGKRTLWKSHKKRLRYLGFAKTEGERRFVRLFDVSMFRDALAIKQLLAAVIYEVVGRNRIVDPLLEIPGSGAEPPGEEAPES